MKYLLQKKNLAAFIGHEPRFNTKHKETIS